MLLWDLYNEPGNSGMGNRSLPLVEATFDWARQADPSQPLSMGVWNDGLRDLNRVMIERSDIITYHAYTNYQGHARGDRPPQGPRPPGDLHRVDDPSLRRPLGDRSAAVPPRGGGLLQLGAGQRPHAVPVHLVGQAAARPSPSSGSATCTTRTIRPTIPRRSK